MCQEGSKKKALEGTLLDARQIEEDDVLTSASSLWVAVWRFSEMEVPHKTMVYDWKSYQNGWFGGTYTLGNLQIL